MGKFSADVAPLFEEKYMHAVQMQTYGFQRQWDVQDPAQCTHRACYVGGNWFCTRCGAEVYLTCFRKIKTSRRAEVVEGNSVYHGVNEDDGDKEEARKKMDEGMVAFISRETSIICGTSAICSGIHRLDVGQGIVAGMPYDTSNLVQAVGRRGQG
ncbi:hypothetical protein CF328_g7198 [Tilletia controversa]|nr:hypothetical protein CF328_g7198 [Tilletia controversa]